ncbi:hypothetical protein SeLEV6574_g06350 [Synchytrium endobioticum]|uniref:Mevalonate kinase n=1 Tax=Synchytrium endobioticum TaxID=286115 RepID=A0A507CP63_9FUNG|nr:hypothetical protein SeLEV6574_g06350 [Synchytrium endobioticum]
MAAPAAPQAEPGSFLVSAPGKVILFGEHAVVYGKTALAAALGLHTYAWFKTTNDGLARLHFPDVHLHHAWPISDILAALHPHPHPPSPVLGVSGMPAPPPCPMSAAVHSSLTSLLPPSATANAKQAALSFLYLLAKIHPTSPGIHVIVRSSLPIAAGLGSSASYSVCAVSGLLLAAHKIRPAFTHHHLATVNQWSFISEKILHGTPSGIDNALCTYGAAQLFAQGHLEPLPGFTSLRFLLINTCVPRDTKKQVENLKARKLLYPNIIDPLMDAVQGVSESCRHAFAQTPLSRPSITSTLETLIDTNHGLMVAAGVSHPSLETVRRITASHGLVSKLTGGGGGGCAICLIRDDTTQATIRAIESELEAQGMLCFETTVGGPGVQALVLPNDNPVVAMIGCGFDTFATATPIDWTRLYELFPSPCSSSPPTQPY